MKTGDLLLELGTEELPPTSLATLGQALRENMLAALAARGFEAGDAEWFAAPRRLAVRIAGVGFESARKTVTLLGPPADRARDADGNWSQAATGFARKQGVELDALSIIETDKGSRLGLEREEGGDSLHAAFNTVIHEAIAALPIARRMRWGASRAEFVRPVHWVVALLDRECEHGEVLGIATGNRSRGHRFHSPGEVVIATPADYESALEAASVIPGFGKRRELIREQVNQQARELGACAVIDGDLLDEVTGLVEFPVALAGSFDEAFLKVPAEALISSMKEHQKYFHVVDDNGALLPHFITVSNIRSSDPAQVIAGNERVIRPRLADAAFFYEQDVKLPLSERVDALRQVVFQRKLGTLHDKTGRVACLARWLASETGADPDLAERAALLSKADLVSGMVLEFPDLQGIAGAYYARHDGEPEAVAAAIEQQYWPRFAGDRLPDSETGACLALADRLDTLVGIFGIGQPPSGSRDPFALRRAALAVLRIIVSRELTLDLHDALAAAISGYPDGVLGADTEAEVFQYMVERFRAWYEDESISAEVVRSVSALGVSRPLDFQRRVHAVNDFASREEAQALAAANKRVANILAKLEADFEFSEVSDNLLQEAEEKSLAKAVASLRASNAALLEQGRYADALAALAGLRDGVDAFFDQVMVNSEDPDLRRNRLSLLKALREEFLNVADISQLAVG